MTATTLDELTWTEDGKHALCPKCKKPQQGMWADRMFRCDESVECDDCVEAEEPAREEARQQLRQRCLATPYWLLINWLAPKTDQITRETLEGMSRTEIFDKIIELMPLSELQRATKLPFLPTN